MSWEWREPGSHHKRCLLQSFSLVICFRVENSGLERNHKDSQWQTWVCYYQVMINLPYVLLLSYHLLSHRPQLLLLKLSFTVRSSISTATRKPPDESQGDSSGVRAVGQQPRLKEFVFQHNQFVEGTQLSGAQSGSRLTFFQTKPPTRKLCQICPSHP